MIMNGPLVRRPHVASLWFVFLAAAALGAACDGVDTRQPGLLVASAGSDAGGASAGGPPLVAGSGGAAGNTPGEELAGLEPTRTCADAGPCSPPVIAGCIPTGERDCSSERDNDCDGSP